MQNKTMLEVIVLLEIKDKASFKKFETKAIKIMREYNGKLLSAFEPNNEESTLPNVSEVHYLEFPDLGAFNNYRDDLGLKELRELRNKGVSQTTIIVSKNTVTY